MQNHPGQVFFVLSAGPVNGRVQKSPANPGARWLRRHIHPFRYGRTTG
jgi:hypothetical protein